MLANRKLYITPTTWCWSSLSRNRDRLPIRLTSTYRRYCWNCLVPMKKMAFPATLGSSPVEEPHQSQSVCLARKTVLPLSQHASDEEYEERGSEIRVG